MKQESPRVILFPSFPPKGKGEKWKEKEREIPGRWVWLGPPLNLVGTDQAVSRALLRSPARGPKFAAGVGLAGLREAVTVGGIRVAPQGVRCIPEAAGPRAPGTLPGPRGLARALPDQRRRGPREVGREDRWEDREPLRRRRRGLREARRRRSSGAAGGRAALSLRRTADPTSPWQPPVPGPAESLNP